MIYTKGETDTEIPDNMAAWAKRKKKAINLYFIGLIKPQ